MNKFCSITCSSKSLNERKLNISEDVLVNDVGIRFHTVFSYALVPRSLQNSAWQSLFHHERYMDSTR